MSDEPSSLIEKCGYQLLDETKFIDEITKTDTIKDIQRIFDNDLKLNKITQQQYDDACSYLTEIEKESNKIHTKSNFKKKVKKEIKTLEDTPVALVAISKVLSHTDVTTGGTNLRDRITNFKNSMKNLFFLERVDRYSDATKVEEKLIQKFITPIDDSIITNNGKLAQYITSKILAVSMYIAIGLAKQVGVLSIGGAGIAVSPLVGLVGEFNLAHKSIEEGGTYIPFVTMVITTGLAVGGTITSSVYFALKAVTNVIEVNESGTITTHGATSKTENDNTQNLIDLSRVSSDLLFNSANTIPDNTPDSANTIPVMNSIENILKKMKEWWEKQSNKNKETVDELLKDKTKIPGLNVTFASGPPPFLQVTIDDDDKVTIVSIPDHSDCDGADCLRIYLDNLIKHAGGSRKYRRNKKVKISRKTNSKKVKKSIKKVTRKSRKY
jgi:hypothetical protein